MVPTRGMRKSTMRKILVFIVALFSLTFALTDLSVAALSFVLAISLFSRGFVLRIPPVRDESLFPALPRGVSSEPALA